MYTKILYHLIWAKIFTEQERKVRLSVRNASMNTSVRLMLVSAKSYINSNHILHVCGVFWFSCGSCGLSQSTWV